MKNKNRFLKNLTIVLNWFYNEILKHYFMLFVEHLSFTQKMYKFF